MGSQTAGFNKDIVEDKRKKKKKKEKKRCRRRKLFEFN